MRTVLTRSLLILGLLFGGAFNATATELPCNQSFSPLYLRYGAYHYLEDKVSNPNNFPLYAQSMYAEFSTLGYFVGGGKLDNPVLWDIPANANNLVLMRSEFPVHIANHPAVRSTDMVRGDIYAQYVMTWDILNTVTTADDTTHVECQPYIVTWCGDGVKDTQLDYMGVPYESCDDGAQNGQPGKCNATCSGTVPLTPVPGVCGTSNGQTLPSAPVTNLCAAGTPTAVTGAGPWTWSCTGLNGGVNSPICTANPLPPPVNGVCSSTVTGPQSSPLVNGACNLGTVIGFGSTGTNPVNYKWNCSGTNGGNNSPDCNASYTPPPPPVAGVCSSTVTGPQSSPLVNGACNVGGAINFVANGTNPALYTWNCSGSNGGPNSPNCTASYTPPPPPVNGVCSSTVTGPQSAPLLAGVCNAGTVAGFTSIGTNPVNYTWSCIGQNGGTNSSTCTASYTPLPPPVNGVCSSTVTGPQSSPLVTGACNAGSVVGFLASGTNPVNYSWTCGGINGGTNSSTCTANYTPPVTNFAVSIKKYVDTFDAQTISGAVVLNTGDSFDYILKVKNEGPAATSGITTVTDSLPSGVILNGAISAPGWICTGTTNISCASSSVIAANAFYSDITLHMKVTATGGTITNVGTVSNPGGSTPTGPTTDPGVIVVPPPPVCSTTYVGALPAPINATTPGLCNVGTSMTFMLFASGTTQNFTWSCKSGTQTVGCNAHYTPPVNHFAISIKKYVNTFDAQTVSGAVILNTGDSFDYILKVQNEGPDASVGTVTVTDVLPVGVVLDGPISAPGWTCVGTTTIICVNSNSIAGNSFFPDITLHMKVTATSGTITNIGSVSAPGCEVPVGPTTDPGVIVVAPPPVCDPGKIGVQLSPLTMGYCASGTATGFTAVGTNPINYSWSCKNVKNQSVTCNASYVPVPPPPPPKCSSTLSGALASPISNGACDSGTATGFTAVGTNPVNYSWSCKNAINESVTCNASYSTGSTASCNSISVSPTSGNIPLVSNVSCNTTNATTVTITCGNGQTLASSTGTCTYATVGTFTPTCTVDGTITNASCKGTVTTTNVTPPPSSYVSIKKYAGTLDGQDATGALQVVPGSSFNYRYDVSNTGTVAATGVVVTDTLPQYVTINSITKPAGWTCTQGTMTGGSIVYPTVVCSTPSLASGATVSITVNATLSLSTPANAQLRNIAYVCKQGDAPTVNCDPTCIVDPTNPRCNPPPPPPQCDPMPGSPHYDPACVVVPPSSYVSIKKYAGTLDGQDATGALQVVPGSSFNYRYDVSNTGTVAATGVVVTDTLPQYVTINSITKPAGWTCTQGTMTGGSIVYPTVVCSTPSLASGATVSITVNATLSLSTPANAQLRNIAYVCKQGDAPTVNCDPTCIVDPTNPRCNPPPPPPQCDPMPGSPHYDPACVVTPPSTNRSCDTLASLPSGSTLSPSVDVTYTCTATGAIAVPANLEYSIKCGAGDTSTGSTYTGSNTRVCRTPSTNSTSQTITCAVRDKSTGIVFSGSEIGACNVTKTTSGGSSTAMLYVPKCVNGNPTCATTGNYADTALCKIGEGRDCYTNQADCDVAKGSLSCGGGGCSGPNCGTCVGSSCSNGGGYCGDGVLQSGEECDVSGATWCGQRGERDYLGNLIECQIKGLTIPGDNPITDLWMTIPLLSHTRLGYTWLDTIGNTGKIRFNDNGMVLGVNTRAFTIADKVGFGIKREYNVPLTVEANKIVCLTSSGTSMNSNTACTNFGDLVPASMKFTVPATGQEYVLIGNGDYQVRQLDGTYRQYTVTGNPNNIDLFKGANTYVTSNGNMKLYEAFYGTNIGLDGQLALYHRSISTGEPIPLAALRVNVSGAKVGGTSSTVNRKLETYINSTSIVSIFLSGFQGYTTTTSSTNAVGGGSATAVNGGVTVSTTAAPPGGLIVLGAAIPASYRLNGNDNIYSVRGDVIMNCTSGITATELQGVRTLIVENGDLIINCNNGYGSSDISSSWAFIVKNGNIRVAKEVTNMAGIYVSIGTPGVTACDGTGNLCSLGNQATNNILRVNGSMYGNAKPLFDSRLYVRGTNAYDILTTGVIISYSNRALVNPPPLLSQYLNNYSVTRVVK